MSHRRVRSPSRLRLARPHPCLRRRGQARWMRRQARRRAITAGWRSSSPWARRSPSWPAACFDDAMTPPYVAVVGPGDADAAAERDGETAGRVLAEHGAVVVCGGLGGVMAAACRGAREAGGMTVGLLPGSDRAAANPWVAVAIATGLGELRNGLVVRAADAVIAVGGAFGTLSEIALALKRGKPVIGLGTWELDAPILRAADPEEAAALGFRHASGTEL